MRHTVRYTAKHGTKKRVFVLLLLILVLSVWITTPDRSLDHNKGGQTVAVQNSGHEGPRQSSLLSPEGDGSSLNQSADGGSSAPGTSSGLSSGAFSEGSSAGEVPYVQERTEEAAPLLAEEDIYTFLQGPKAWASKTDWSGAWCDEFLAGQKFSVFGCGLCDLANIYSTLTPYDCSPLDMYAYAQEVSDYRPVSGYGAIDWPELKKTLSSVGISSEICVKDSSYEAFAKKAASSLSMITLVSSYNDSSYWHEAEGHYVNLWLYDEEDETVFLADSGDPEHNRSRIPLKTVYDALKTGADYQYLIVTGCDEAANTWKHDGIEAAWTVPDYYKYRD